MEAIEGIEPIEAKKTFDTIAQRILYGLKFLYAEFEPVESEIAGGEEQRTLHRAMGRMIDRLYDDPALLGLAGDADEAFEWYALNNANPELDAVYKSVFKRLFGFYTFLYMASLHGAVTERGLTVGAAVLRENKAGYAPVYGALLGEAGMRVEKSGSDIVIGAERAVLQSLRLLAERVPVHVNPWTPYALIHFAGCSFTGDFSFLLARIDRLAGLGGLLLELRDECLESGYEQSIRCTFGASGFEAVLSLRRGVGGFVIGYNPRKRWQFYFGSMNSIGVKAMLEDFERLDDDLKKHLLGVCKACSGCRFCAKGGRNALFAVRVRYGGGEHILCPDNYNRHVWETMDRERAAALFKYHDAQEIYGSDRKKKRPAHVAKPDRDLL